MRTSDLEYSKLKHKQFCATEKKEKNLVKKKKPTLWNFGGTIIGNNWLSIASVLQFKKE